jgi:hypothetical protein
MAGQIADLSEANEVLVAKLARLEYLLSRTSKNSSSPPSRDGDPGRMPPQEKRRRGGGPRRSKGKQPGAPGATLAWTDTPDERTDRFPQGRCECGHDLADASDLGVVDCYQQHEIPPVSVQVTQYDQHRVRCGCGRVHTAERPGGGPVGDRRVRAESGGLRGVSDGGARHSRAPLCRVAAVADRGRALGGVRARHARPYRGAAGRG